MPKDCHTMALRYLEHQERSAREVRQHLLSKGFDREEIESEIQDLEDLRYLDDARYCDNYIRYAVRKGRGPVRIRFELKEKGLNPELIQKALEIQFDRESERCAAMKEAAKLLKASNTNGRRKLELEEGSYEGEESDQEAEPTAPDEKTIAKIGRKLAAQGYHSEIIYDVIGRLQRN